MGILLEADYKRVLSGKESPLSGLRRAFDPREREGEQQQLTYEAMNRDSGVLVRWLFSVWGVLT